MIDWSEGMDVSLGSRWDPEADEVKNPEPYDYGEAKRAHARASRDQTEAAKFVALTHRKFAQAQAAYKKAKADAIVAARLEYPATVAVEIANGDAEVCRLRMERDIAQGMTRAADQLGWKATKDRAVVEQLVTWSMKVAPLGDFPEGAKAR